MSETSAMATRAAEAVDFLDGISKEHDAAVFAMFSGGDDSLACALVTSQAERFGGCVHIDTGTGIPETRQYVEATCREQGWPLKIYSALDCGQDYEVLCEKYGFPGPPQHFRMFSRLKERPLRVFIREHKRHRKDRLVLSTGARSSESARRMSTVQPVDRRGVQVWANPIHAWTKTDCLTYIAERGVPRNEVVRLMHMSGECLCGCFAGAQELEEIELWFPEVGARIRALEARVKAAGHKSCHWGCRPNGKPNGRVRPRKQKNSNEVGPLCSQCEVIGTE